MTPPAGLGLTEYRDYCELLGLPVNPDLAPGERAASLPRWLVPELVPTEAARQRLRHWAALKRPPLTRGVIERDLVALGFSGAARGGLTTALRHMAPPVVHLIVHHVWLVSVPHQLAGWTWQAPPAPRGALHLMTVSGSLAGSDLQATVGHEAAHVWLMDAAPAASVPTLRDRARAAALPRTLAQRWRRPDLAATEDLRAHRVAQRDERQAAALAAAWGFRGAPADPELAADLARPAAMQWW